jgi:uncharacterized membrane protein
MAQLIVVAFKGDIFRAGEVLHKLSELNEEWAIDLDDAVAVYRDHNGQLHVDESYQMTTGQEAALGAFWGALIPALIALPFTAGASAVVAAGAFAAVALSGSAVGAIGGALDAKWWKEEFGIPDPFVKTAAGMIQPRDSAIFALLRTVDPDRLAEEFRGYGGSVVQTTLTEDQAFKVQAILDGSGRPGADVR